MVTVQNVVAKELDQNVYLVELLLLELANVNAIANKILPAVSKDLRMEVKLSAVSMAIRRYISDFSKIRSLQWKFPKNLEIATKTNVFEVAVERTPDFLVIMKELYSKVKRRKGNFISIIDGTYEISIFTNQSNKEIILDILKRRHITSERDNLSYVTVNWENVTKDIPGIYYRITRALAFKGISIQSFHTIGAEMMIFFSQEQFPEAYKIIGQLLHNNRDF